MMSLSKSLSKSHETPVYLRCCRDAGCQQPVFFEVLPEIDYPIGEGTDRLEVRHGWPPTEAKRTFTPPEIDWEWQSGAHVVVTLNAITRWIEAVHQYEHEL